MSPLLIPAALSLAVSVQAAECPFFGSLDPARNYECLIEEYQGYADALADKGMLPVVVSQSEYATAQRLFTGGVLHTESGCIAVLPAPFGFDDLWDAEDRCGRGL